MKLYYWTIKINDSNSVCIGMRCGGMQANSLDVALEKLNYNYFLLINSGYASDLRVWEVRSIDESMYFPLGG